MNFGRFFHFIFAREKLCRDVSAGARTARRPQVSPALSHPAARCVEASLLAVPKIRKVRNLVGNLENLKKSPVCDIIIFFLCFTADAAAGFVCSALVDFTHPVLAFRRYTFHGSDPAM